MLVTNRMHSQGEKWNRGWWQLTMTGFELLCVWCTGKKGFQEEKSYKNWNDETLAFFWKHSKGFIFHVIFIIILFAES